ncbi:hypothetical protein T459_27823 [Capsicum annuum]|uniref:Protein kinase domain-containing protein n=1 Tax=Capsicum annuum TaxID=4072 RepID=A0A2G2YF18_CAPAN|nr:hypothetical protein T459_27823 [Capsicum annuum]
MYIPLLLMKERKLESSGVPEEEQMNLLKELEKKETEYIRQKHHKIYVADFEILTIIGRGAFGEVEHVRAKRNLLAEVASHFIVKLFYSFQDFDYLYLVMEYLPGGYMMMDMKPNNLVLDKNVHMMLSDFGLCKPLDHSNSLPINDGEKRGSANKWSLGAIMYEMLVGYPPFYFEDPITTYRKTVHWRNHITYLEEARLTSKAKDLICRLLCDAENRLSCQGSEQIKVHPWCKDIKWDKLYDMEATYKLEVNDDVDT